MKAVLKHYRLFLLPLAALLAAASIPVHAEKTSNTKVARASFGSEDSSAFQLDKTTRLRYSPVALPGGAKLTLISPQQWMPMANKLTGSLEGLHSTFQRIFGTIPPFEVSLRLMDDEQFYRKTGAPRWTNAMFYRGQIIIPLSSENTADIDNIYRSVKHEYSHAVVHALSGGTCPGWLDEGLAQWVEGEENPSLLPAMVQWVNQKKQPLSFDLLQGGFTGLQKEKVPVAYAQSLYSTRYIFKEHGLGKIRKYLKLLREKKTKSLAFEESFELTESEFESKFSSYVKRLGYQHRHKVDR